MKPSNLYELLKGFYKENPVLVSLLGMCPTLAITTQTINGITMGAAVTFVLIFSNLIISLFKNIIPSNVRNPVYIIIIATFVTMIKILVEAFAPDINDSLGIFLPLIVVNCIILARAEIFASKNSAFRSVLDGLGMGLGFLITITLIAFIRETLGAGQITLKVAGLGEIYDLNGFYQWIGMTDQLGNKAPIGILLLPPGGFFVVGIMIGVLNFFQVRIKNRILMYKSQKLLKQEELNNQLLNKKL